jgi:hypothetical protein
MFRMFVFENKEEHYLAYATDRKVIGLVKLPLDGNLYKSIGIIAHSHDVYSRIIFMLDQYHYRDQRWQVSFHREQEHDSYLECEPC